MLCLPHARRLDNSPAFPRPADLPAADRLREAFTALGAAERRFAESEDGRAVLDCLGGNAPYLAELACRESACLLATLRDGPEKAFAASLDALHALRWPPRGPASPRHCGKPNAAPRSPSPSPISAISGNCRRSPARSRNSRKPPSASPFAIFCVNCMNPGRWFCHSRTTRNRAPVSWRSPSVSSAPGN